MIVLVIIGTVTAIAIPRTSQLRDRNAVRSARQQVAGLLANTRAYAIRRAQTAQLRFQSNAAWITATPIGGGTPSTVSGKTYFDNLRVTVSGVASPDSVVYDPRGLAQNLTATKTITFTRNAVKDSLCIGRLGLVAQKCGF